MLHLDQCKLSKNNQLFILLGGGGWVAHKVFVVFFGQTMNINQTRLGYWGSNEKDVDQQSHNNGWKEKCVNASVLETTLEKWCGSETVLTAF